MIGIFKYDLEVTTCRYCWETYEVYNLRWHQQGVNYCSIPDTESNYDASFIDQHITYAWLFEKKLISASSLFCTFPLIYEPMDKRIHYLATPNYKKILKITEISISSENSYVAHTLIIIKICLEIFCIWGVPRMYRVSI